MAFPRIRFRGKSLFTGKNKGFTLQIGSYKYNRPGVFLMIIPEKEDLNRVNGKEWIS